MFISAFILVICSAAMVQFAVFSWRAGLLRTISTEPSGEQAEVTAEISRNLLNGRDFADVASLQGLCPDLKNGRANLRPVRVYYSFLKAMNRLGDLIVAPGADGFGGWTDREMALCTQYTAAVLAHRLRSNQELAAEVRSY
jgi:hypothetical protein